jgi:signal transduction histidine kinase
MRLRGRFTLWFALAAVVPIMVAAFITREVLSRSYRKEYALARSAAEQGVRREVTGLETELAKAVAAVADRESPLVGGLLQDMKKEGAELSHETRRRTKETANQTQRGLFLDVLTLLDGDDVVLAAPHYRAVVGDSDPVPAQRARGRDAPFFTTEPVLDGAKVRPILVAEAVRTVRDGPYQVTLVGGRALDADVLDSVRRPGRADLRVVGAGGEVLIPAAEPWEGWSDTPPTRIPLEGFDGAPVAWVEVAVSDADLRGVLRELTVVAIVLALAALGITILVGVVIARRMTRDLDQLAVGAQAAARGDLDHRVDIRSRDEVGAVAASFNQMMEDLRGAKERLVIAERIAAWQEIARRLAHEIKNPLTPIQMAIDTLRKTWKKKHPSFDEIFEESTSTVLEEAARLKRIVGEFSDFARMPKPTLGPCDLNELVTGALSLYEGSIVIERRLAPDLPPIEADKDQLAQVFYNLLENARDAIAGRLTASQAAAVAAVPGKITVETRRGDQGDRVILLLDDNGPGIPSEIKDKLFTPYFTTKHGKDGTGLGLAIVHRIIADHGGRISPGDAPGGGARFTVELPTHQTEPLHSLPASRLGAG